MTNTDNLKSKKKTVLGIVTTIVLIIAVFFCVCIAVQVFGKGYASFGNNSMFRVVTGSMSPTITENALIVAHKTDIDEVKVGDIVTFRSRSAEMAGSIITHRVFKIINENGKTLLYTKGDANSAEDVLPVDSENYIGKVTKIMQNDSFLPFLISFFSSESGFIVCIVLPILVIAGIIMQKSIKNIKNDMSSLVSEIEKIKNEGNSVSDSEKSDNMINDELAEKSALSDEEYTSIYTKIKAELLTEIMEELKDSDKR